MGCGSSTSKYENAYAGTVQDGILVIQKQAAREFSSISKEYIEKALRLNITIAPLFEDMTDDEFSAFLDSKQPMILEKDHVLTFPGDRSQNLYLLVDGALNIIFEGTDKPPMRVTPGRCVCELAFKHAANEQAITVMSTTPSKVYSFSRKELDRILFDVRPQFDKVPILARLSKSKRDFVAQNSKIVKIKKGELIYQPGDSVQNFHVILKGQVGLTKNPDAAEYFEKKERMGYFGHDNFLRHRLSKHYAIAVKHSTLLLVPKKIFHGPAFEAVRKRLQEKIWVVEDPGPDGSTGDADDGSVVSSFLDPFGTGWVRNTHREILCTAGC